MGGNLILKSQDGTELECIRDEGGVVVVSIDSRCFGAHGLILTEGLVTDLASWLKMTTPIEITDRMIYAYAGEPEITATDAYAIGAGLCAALKAAGFTVTGDEKQ